MSSSSTEMAKHRNEENFQHELILSEDSVLGNSWIPVFSTGVDINANHFQAAMSNLIRQPNVNSTVIMRADILKENKYEEDEGDSLFTSKLINEFPKFDSDNDKSEVLHKNLMDTDLRTVDLDTANFNFSRKVEVVRRLIPRNPFKDPIINQSCLIFREARSQNESSNQSVLIIYIPHLDKVEDIPFYLPSVYAIGILYHEATLSIHYYPFKFPNSHQIFRSLDPSDRSVRIALRLLLTSKKHSQGIKSGYQKRVHHDLIVPRFAFQNRYISLKGKYSAHLVNNWVESTDPKKHVFEDLAIAAFLIELWSQRYKSKHDFEFRDLGCGNGLLVYILIMEGYRGKGIDARSRKSWALYPEEVSQNLLEQVLVPSILLKPHPSVSKLAPDLKDNGRIFKASLSPADKDKYTDGNSSANYHSSTSLLDSPQVSTTEDFSPNTFIIGNHSDELTCWIPLLEFPFMVIPCCSHSLSGTKVRYPPKRTLPNSEKNQSTYGALVNHVEEISYRMGWKVEKEMLRIPSTRNAAILATERNFPFSEENPMETKCRVLDIIAMEGGADGWVENSTALMNKSPRSH